MVTFPTAAPPPAPRAHCTLHVARWFGPSRALQEALAPWTAERGLTVTVVDTLAACKGRAALTPPAPSGSGAAASTRARERAKVDELNAAVGPPVVAGGWPGAVLAEDVEAVRAGWPHMDAPARLTACTLAAAAGANAVLAAVLELDARLARGVDADPAGNTPLHYAALGANAVGVRLLLRHGASPGAQNPVGTLPVHDAARAADPVSIAALATVPILQGANRYGDTVRHRLALYGGDKPEVRVITCLKLVARKIRDACGPRGLRALLARTNVDGFTPLDLAVAGGEFALARRLEAYGAVHGDRWRTRRGAGFTADEVVHVPFVSASDDRVGHGPPSRAAAR